MPKPWCRIVAVIILAAGLAACGGNTDQTPPPPEVSVITITPHRLPVTWHFTGRAAGYRTIQIRSRVDGILLEISYTEGSFVEKGDVLFRVDPTEYKLAVAQQKARVAQARADLDQAQRTLSRVKPLYKSGVISGQKYDSIVSKVQNAAANLQAEKAALEQAQTNLSYTTITAPISGLVGESNMSVGALIRASQATPLTTIVQTDPIYVYFSLSASEYFDLLDAVEAGHVKLPDNNEYEVTLTLGDGTQYTHTGKIDFKSNVIDPDTGTIQLRAIFANAEGALVPNEFVRVSINGAVRPEAILVPQRAVMQNADGQYVYVVNDDNKIETRTVETGEWIGTDWLIKAGLQAGDRVVTDGLMRLRPGVTVKVTSGGSADESPDDTSDHSV